MSLPAPLMFTIGLIDQITKPIAKISKQFNGLASNYQAGTMQMASGIGGIAASGYALQKALMPAIEMDRALGEVKSLGVRQSALKMLTDTSYEYALKYGKSSTEFIKSSYDIQSAIAGLNDADLSAFTLSSNVLAAATKADAATVTSYMGTMYGIFQNQANAMGKSEWVAQVTGMTASAVQAFKTTGAEMSGAFTAIGAEATSAGIAMSEQMAILGTLQATMSGSESGTKYKAFLAGVGKAQKALGLTFTDSQGRLLPMVDVLNKIKGKYGDVIDVAESDALARAFGSSEAVSTVKLLMGNIGGLSDSINTLGKVKGMEQAEIMASAMTDQSERLAQSWFVIRAAFGSAVLPAFNSFVGKIADMGKSVISFTNLYPNITRAVGQLGIGILGLVVAGGLFTVMMGASKMAMVAWNLSAMITGGIYKILTLDLTRLGRQMKLMPYFLQRWSRTSKIAAAAQWALNLAMNANPIGLVIAGIAALIAIVGAAIYYFDDLRDMMKGTAWGEPILFAVDAIANVLKMLGNVAVKAFSIWMAWIGFVWKAIKPIASLLLDVVVFALKVVGAVAGLVFGGIALLIGGLANLVTWVASSISAAFTASTEWISNIFTSMVNGISNQWQAFTDWFTSTTIGETLSAKFSAAGDIIRNMWTSIKGSFSDTWEWIVGNLNKIPGIDIDVGTSFTPEVKAVSKQQAAMPEMFKNSQAPMPSWMKQTAANDPVNYVYNTPQPARSMIQNNDISRSISPKFDKGLSAAAQSQRSMTAAQTKQINFGDVIIHNPPKGWSLSEIADQQELRTA
ncbi:phage tail tape measure protein [Shewanella frigidimarina]|uniref:phage tail tape measure protein n=1 Tax=Shewanella frigidimarina TaxID=56812 RepID=UPI003D78D028